MGFLSALDPYRFMNPGNLVLYEAGLVELAGTLNCTRSYVCVTLARTSYLEGIGVDITPAPDTSPVSGFFGELVPGFLADLSVDKSLTLGRTMGPTRWLWVQRHPRLPILFSSEVFQGSDRQRAPRVPCLLQSL